MAQKTWFKENQKWFLPTIIGSVLTLIFSSVVIGFIFIAGLVKTSTIYKISMAKAKKNPDVRRVIGDKVKGGLFIDGTISVSHLSGEADFSIPLSGANGEGSLRVIAQKVEDKWIYSTLEVYVNDSTKVIELLPEEKDFSGK